MISSEVQRTLVKSPPELWAEISDPESLARHLGEFGEIRITHVKPEQKVEWEAEDASGTVVIKPSGWGTKVKLTVTREFAEPEAATEVAVAADAETPEPQTAAELDDEAESDAKDVTRTGTSLELESPAEPDPHAEAHGETEPQGEAETHAAVEPAAQPEPEPRRGFFARLFGRRRAHTEELSPVVLTGSAPIASEPNEPSEPSEDEPLSADIDAPEHDFELVDQRVHAPEPAPSAAVDEPTDTVAQPHGELAEELAAEEVTAVLTGVLDRLGAAHHRPFSRA
jgi:hypothetical protein